MRFFSKDIFFLSRHVGVTLLLIHLIFLLNARGSLAIEDDHEFHPLTAPLARPMALPTNLQPQPLFNGCRCGCPLLGLGLVACCPLACPILSGDPFSDACEWKGLKRRGFGCVPYLATLAACFGFAETAVGDNRPSARECWREGCTWVSYSWGGQMHDCTCRCTAGDCGSGPVTRKLCGYSGQLAACLVSSAVCGGCCSLVPIFEESEAERWTVFRPWLAPRLEAEIMRVANQNAENRWG